MKLERLHLRNFRCFDELTVDFDPSLTVIVGKNGAGKSALLDAIAIGFGRYLTKLPGVSGRSTKETDIKVVRDERQQPFMMLAWEATTLSDESVVWSWGKKRNSAVTASDVKGSLNEDFQNFLHKGLKQIDNLALGLVRADNDGESYFLPIIAYYGTNRAIRDEVQRRRGFRKSFSRFDALSGALEPDSRFRSAFEWFNALEDQERREKELRRDFDYRLPELQEVRESIERVLPGKFRNPRTEIRPLRFVIDEELSDGRRKTLRITQLSDGYRVVLGLVMDLSRRMAQANGPFVQDDSKYRKSLDLPAIVLIDEVDLHLHPSWQQRVLSDLRRTFPGAQFIVTTHSPQVLSTVKKDKVRVLYETDEGGLEVRMPLSMTYGEPSGVVLHSVMSVDPQPPIEEKGDLQQLTQLVDGGQYDTRQAALLMQRLRGVLGEDHPQLQRLQRSIGRQMKLRGG